MALLPSLLYLQLSVHFVHELDVEEGSACGEMADVVEDGAALDHLDALPRREIPSASGSHWRPLEDTGRARLLGISEPRFEESACPPRCANSSLTLSPPFPHSLYSGSPKTRSSWNSLVPRKSSDDLQANSKCAV